MKPPITRKDPLTSFINAAKPIYVVEIKEVTMDPQTKAPLHLHPCSTLGIVTEGTIVFQIEGKETTYLKTGDAFHEPKNIRISKFNNEGNVPAKFIVFYLLENKEDETIQILEKPI